MQRRQSKKKSDNKQLFMDIFIGSALFIVTGIMPLIVRLADRPMPPEMVYHYMMERYADGHAYWKGWFLGVPVSAVILYLISDLPYIATIGIISLLGIVLYFTISFLLHVNEAGIAKNLILAKFRRGA